MRLEDPHARIFVAGHRGLVGSAVARELGESGYDHLVTRTRSELDLRDPTAVSRFFDAERPEFVVLAAARVGGILANDTWPVDFLYDNLAIQTAVIHAAHAAGVRRLIFLGSTCIYPKRAPQPLREEALLTGPLEPTNEWYAVAKIAGVKLCQAFRRQHGADFVSLMPTNLYGPGDNFDPRTSHVLPALIHKFDGARSSGGPVTLWGSGTPRREFLHVDDLARAVRFILETDEHVLHGAAPDGMLNVGVGEDITIYDLARLVADVVGYDGRIELDPSKPDGTPRKLVDVTRMTDLGWTASIPLRQGIADTWRWYAAQPR